VIVFWITPKNASYTTMSAKSVIHPVDDRDQVNN